MDLLRGKPRVHGEEAIRHSCRELREARQFPHDLDRDLDLAVLAGRLAASEERPFVKVSIELGASIEHLRSGPSVRHNAESLTQQGSESES